MLNKFNAPLTTKANHNSSEFIGVRLSVRLLKPARFHNFNNFKTAVKKGKLLVCGKVSWKVSVTADSERSKLYVGGEEVTRCCVSQANENLGSPVSVILCINVRIKKVYTACHFVTPSGRRIVLIKIYNEPQLESSAFSHNNQLGETEAVSSTLQGFPSAF